MASSSKNIVALLLALALVASATPPSEAIRVQAASKPEAAVGADQEAPEKAAATNPPAGQLPGFPFPFFPLPGAPAAGGQAPGFPFPFSPLPGFPFPLLPLPGGGGGAPPAAGGQVPGLPFPLFPPLFPAPPAAGGVQFPGFPFPLFPFPFPSIPGFTPINHPSPPASPVTPPTPTSPTSPSAGTAPALPPTSSPVVTPSPSPPPASPSPTSSPVVTPSPPPQVTDCLPPLMALTPCMDYLTNAGGVSAPPSACCHGFRTLVSDAPICLCHGLNGDINKLMPAPLDFTRMMSLPATCSMPLPMQALAKCSTEPVPPLSDPAPAPVSAPSPDSTP